MKKRLTVIGLITFLLSFGNAWSAERYLCEPDKGSGYRYNQTLSRWMQKSFEADAKYLITKTGETNFSLEKTNSEDAYQCEQIENLRPELNNTRWVRCETADHLKTFMFNGSSKRFIWQSMGDYLHQPISANPSASQGDVVTFIGKCSAL